MKLRRKRLLAAGVAGLLIAAAPATPAFAGYWANPPGFVDPSCEAVRQGPILALQFRVCVHGWEIGSGLEAVHVTNVDLVNAQYAQVQTELWFDGVRAETGGCITRIFRKGEQALCAEFPTDRCGRFIQARARVGSRGKWSRWEWSKTRPYGRNC